MRYDGEHKARTRERLLEAAAKAIRTDGPDRLTVADVMRAAGLTHGAFYAHFASKDDLVSEAIDHLFETRRAFLDRAMEGATPREAMRRIVSSYLSMAHRDTPQDGCPIPILAGEQHRLPDAGRRRFAAAVARLTDTIAGLLADAGDPAPQATADSAVSEMIGAVSLARVQPDERAAALLDAAKCSVLARLGVHDAGM